MLNMNGNSVKVIVVPLEHVVLGTLAGHCFDGKHNLVMPLFDRHAQLKPLTGQITPLNETSSCADSVVRYFVG